MSDAPLTKDPLLTDIRAALLAWQRWTSDYAEKKFAALLNRALDRIEQLQMPHAEVLRIAERGDDGADAVALMNALCKKVEAQRRRIAQMERDAKEDTRSTATEAAWKERQGEDYGSY
jgi:hypothetical protein